MSFSIDNLRSLGGVLFVLAIAWALSSGRRNIHIKPVVAAICLQATIGIAVFAVEPLRTALTGITGGVIALQAATLEGTQFAFGYLAGGDAPFEIASAENNFILTFQVLPVILVISTLAALFWHWGVLERICVGLGYVFRRVMGVSGPPSLGASASVFLGMVEAPMVIRPYLNRMSRADILLVMSAAMATIAGTMMAVYIAVLIPHIPEASAHIIAASFMAAPGAIAIARIMEPPAGEVRKGDSGVMPKFYQSTMDAFVRGVQDGLSVFLSVVATIIVSLALIALIDMALAAALPDVGGAPVSARAIMGWVLSPVMFMLGIPWQDAATSGQLVGTKLLLNELLAFVDLAALPTEDISPRTRLMMIYVLCGFANFGALAIMLGAMSSMAPDRRDDILQLGLKSLVGGVLANMLSGAIVGALPFAI